MARTTAAFWRLLTAVRALGVCSVLVAAGLVIDMTAPRGHTVSLPFLTGMLAFLGLWGRAEKRHRSRGRVG